MDLTAGLNPEVRNHPQVQLSDNARPLNAATRFFMITVHITGRAVSRAVRLISSAALPLT